MPNFHECPACQRRGVVHALDGKSVVRCPLCQGVGMVEPQYLRLPLWYIVNQVLLANERISPTLRIDARADFEWLYAISSQTGIFRTRIKDSAGRNYDNAAVNNVNQWGTAQLPFAFMVPPVIVAQTTLEFDMEDTSGAGNTVQLALAGFELFPIHRGE